MKYVLIIILLVFLGCSGNSHKEVTDMVTYVVDYKKNDAYFWDTYFEHSHHVVLETNENSLFQEISKLVVKDHRIYLLCSSMKKVIVFDLQGRFINSICRYGEGPEEYLSAVDIHINDDNTIDILDNFNSKINTYTLVGEFVNKKNSISASAFLRVDTNTYIFNRNNYRGQVKEPKPFNFLCVRNDSILNKKIPYIELMAGISFSFGEGNSFIYPYNYGISVPHNDTLYVFDRKTMELKSSCLFDFQIERPNNSMSESELDIYMNAYRAGDIPSSLYCVYDMGTSIFGVFNYNNGVKHVLISTTNNETLVSTPILNKDGIPILPIPYSDDSNEKYIVSLLNPLFVKRRSNLKEKALLSEINKKIEDEESNPVLVFWKRKER